MIVQSLGRVANFKVSEASKGHALVIKEQNNNKVTLPQVGWGCPYLSQVWASGLLVTHLLTTVSC